MARNATQSRDENHMVSLKALVNKVKRKVVIAKVQKDFCGCSSEFFNIAFEEYC